MTKPELNISPAGGRIAPEFFPIPPRGPDPHFGISRSSWYDLEARGLLRLVRLRKPGNIRGRVLVPYAAALVLFNKLSAERAPA
jgi:hypothetical protein